MKSRKQLNPFNNPFSAISILLFFILFCTVSSASENKVRILKTDEGYQFYDAENPILFYQTQPKTTPEGTHSRANYCHPLYGLDGQIMTEDFPPDHLHHRGIFWAWHQVYIGETLIRDMWDCTDFTWDIQEIQFINSGENSDTLRAKVGWKSPQWKNNQKAFVTEDLTIRMHPVINNARLIDFKIELLALEEGIRIGGSDDIKGYGGFSTRIILPKDIELNDSNGPVTPEVTAVIAGDWMNFKGTFGKDKSGFAIFIHPSNPGESRDWILRKSGSAQNVAFPGRQPIPLSTKTPLVLKYRLVIHKEAGLDTLYKEYCAEK